MEQSIRERTVTIPIGRGIELEGTLGIPEGAHGVVLFAHGSGSSRFSPRNRAVAGVLQHVDLATLLVDLLTAEEEESERYTRHLRFDIGLLATRLSAVSDWLAREPSTAHLPLGYFGSSTGAAAALIAAAQRTAQVKAVVSRGGRPDLAGDALPFVQAPTLLIVGGHDEGVIELNEDAFAKLRCEKRLEIVPGATHLFEERGALEQVARLAALWFDRFLAGAGLAEAPVPAP